MLFTHAIVSSTSIVFVGENSSKVQEYDYSVECTIFDAVISRLSKGRKIAVFDVETEVAICGREGKFYYSLCAEFDKTIAQMRVGAI